MTRFRNSRADVRGNQCGIIEALNFTTVGGAATEAFTVKGAQTTGHVAFAVIKIVGAGTLIFAVNITAPDTVSVTFNIDPSNNTEITIVLIDCLIG